MIKEWIQFYAVFTIAFLKCIFVIVVYIDIEQIWAIATVEGKRFNIFPAVVQIFKIGTTREINILNFAIIKVEVSQL